MVSLLHAPSWILRFLLVGSTTVVALGDQALPDGNALLQHNFNVAGEKLDQQKLRPESALSRIVQQAPRASEGNQILNFTDADIAELLSNIWASVDPFHTTLGIDKKSGREQADKSGEDRAPIMRFLAAVIKAVQDDDFVANMTQMNMDIRETSHRFAMRALEEADNFVRSSTPASEQQLVNLTAALFGDEADAAMVYVEDIQEIALQTMSVLAKDIQTAFRPVMMMMSAQLMNVEVNVPSVSSPEETCTAAVRLMSKVNEADSLMQKLIVMSNSTTRLIPTMWDYLDSMRPEKARRMVELIRMMSDTIYGSSVEVKKLTKTISREVRPVLVQKLKCQLLSGDGHRPERGLGFLIALVSVAVGWLTS